MFGLLWGEHSLPPPPFSFSKTEAKQKSTHITSCFLPYPTHGPFGLLFFKAGPHVAHIGLKLTTYPKAELEFLIPLPLPPESRFTALHFGLLVYR